MKKVLKIVLGIVICLYLVVVVFTTTFLLRKDDYGVSKFMGKSLILVQEDTLEPDYKENTLLVIGKEKAENIEIGKRVFYYDTYGTKHRIKISEVTNKEKVNDDETTFTMKDNNRVSGQYVIGTQESTKAMSTLGQMLYVVQSRWGFLFIVVFPLFLAFLYEIYAIYREFKKK